MRFFQDQTTKKLFAVAIFLLAALVVISMVSSQIGTVSTQLERKDEVGKNVKKPTVSLRTQSEKEIFVVGDTIDIIVSADSKGELVTAFDLVLDYDHSIMKYVEARPLISTYDVILPKNDSKIAIIGSQKINVEKPADFKDTALVLLRFKALKEGSAGLDFAFTPKSDVETNLFDQHNADILKAIRVQPIRVGKNITLKKDVKATIDGGVTLTLKTFYAPQPSCFDCIADAAILVSEGKESKTIDFKSGGIGGRLPEPVAFGGYIFDLVDISAESVTIAYAGL